MSATNLASRPNLRARTAALTGWRRWTALLLLVLIPLTVVGGILGASSARADGPDENKFDLYAVAVSTTSFFNRLMSPDDGMKLTGDVATNWTPITSNPANAGSLLGWSDPDFEFSFDYAAAALSGTSDAQTYASLSTSAIGSNYNGMFDYAIFGAALNGLGLDGTSSGLGLKFFEFFGGGVVLVLFGLSSFVDFLFAGFVQLLALLNPFKLLFDGVANWSVALQDGSTVSGNSEFADGMVGGDANRTGSGPISDLIGGVLTFAFSGLAQFISGIYKTVSGIAWGVMVPVFLATFLFGLLSFKKMNRGGAIKKLLVRIAFIGLGVPLLGMMYTGTINSMAEATKAGNMGAAQVVASTYVDFENWAMNERLAVPEGASIQWRYKNSAPGADSMMKVRDTAFAINAASVPGLSGMEKLIGGDSSVGWSTSAVERQDVTDPHVFEAITSMLTRHMSGAQVQSGDFASGVTTSITSLGSSDDDEFNKTKTQWFESLRNKDIGMPDPAPANNPVLAVADGSGLTVNVVGGADGADSFGALRTYTSSGVKANCGTQVATTGGAPLNCNLSPLAMYNYLNTSFGSDSFTTYSSQKVMSGATKESHNSVNIVGTGAMSALYWVNAVVLLLSFVTITLGYGVALVIGNIRRGIQAISAIPFAMMGALAAIAKVIVYVFAMILEVVLTLFLLKLVQELLLAVPTIVEAPFSLLLNGDSEAAAGAGVAALATAGGAISIGVTLVTIVFVIAFTVMAMRVRKSLLKAIEEAITKLVEKLTDASVGGAPGGKMAPALAGGLGAGAGAAMANRAMHGASGQKGLASGVPGNGKGPDGMGTAGGFTGGTDGGDSSTTVGGEIETGDGTLAVEGGGDAPAPGNGDPGSPLELTAGPSGDSAAAETAEGKRVEAEGLSTDGRGYTVGANGDAVPAKPVQGDSDAMSDVSSSMEESAEGYKAADKQRMAAGTEGAQAVGHGAVAVGRGFAGDAAGAAESGGRAVEHGGAAVAAGEQAKQTEQDAGRSSLDKPSTKHAENAQRAQQVSQVGGTVANAAGAASSTGGAGKAASQGAGAGAAKAPAKAPQATQKGASAPKSTPTAPKQAPRPAAPQRASSTTNVSSTSVDRSSSVDRRSKVVNKSKKRIAPPKPGGKGGKGTKGLKPGGGAGK